MPVVNITSRQQTTLLTVALYIGLIIAGLQTGTLAKFYAGGVFIIMVMSGWRQKRSARAKALFHATLWFWLLAAVTLYAFILVAGASLGSGWNSFQF